MKTRRHVFAFGLATAALVTTASYSSPAKAGIDACGDIHVEANARCEVLVDGGCEAQCEPVRLEAACAAELYANCEGECSADASLDCQATCEGSCMASCVADPGQFDCQAECNADCQGECNASCSSNDSQCQAACEATCSAGCDAECNVTPPSASCDAQCEASCSASCEAQANVDCQAECQADGYAMCTADLQGGCEAQCRQPQGALFCDGQYVDAGNNLADCVAALEAALSIEVEGYAEGACENGACEAEAGGSVTCAVDPAPRQGGWIPWTIAGLLGLVAVRRFA